jgi:hypothetical protein
MNYYTLPKIGTGTKDDPYRPDIPDSTPFVGNIGSDGDYLILTNVELPTKTNRVKQLPIQGLQNACNSKGIPFNDVYNKWNVGGS